ncbi:hypothetical protein OROGR_026368 [Orobanche gracilis]
MDKKSWLWKKKSSDKQVAEKDCVSAPETSGNSQVEKDNNNNERPKHVKLPIESYKHLTGLEDRVKCYEEQVQTLEDEVKELNEKLSEAHSEMTDKDNMVKQHSKVAEEAVSGWEKAEAEAAVLKNQVESMTLLKLTADDKASHLDGALKECMTKIRKLKEEHDKRVHELDLNKTNLFDKMNLQLGSQISNLKQELMKYASDNAALSRSLQERSNTLIKVSGEKSQAEAEIEYLKSNTESREKEVHSLKYEVHIARKEVEIRNEEKNMSVRSLEVVNKQNLEGAKKIAMLEAECQRLRSLVRKKLPGPGALTQMKHEAERLGRHYGEPRLRSSLDSSLKYQKENELLTERLLAMDKERRILKEALKTHNSELEASRSIYARTANMLYSVEARVQANVERGNNQITSKFPVTEDGNVHNVSCAGSGATKLLVSENEYFEKEKTDIPHKHENTNSLDFMYDFLEMEKLGHGSHGANEAVSNSDVSDNKFITELEVAISSIYDFVMIVDKEAKAVQGTSDEYGLTKKLNMFSAKYSEAINSKINLPDFILDVSRVLTYANSERNNAQGYKSFKVENSISSDCIDKKALPGNKCSPNNCPNFSDSTSESDIPSDWNLVPTSESKADSWRCSLEEFEQMKTDKDNLATDFARCTENFESAKSRLVETEQLLDDVRLQLISAQKSNSLSETQLKCMAESYKALEAQEDQLQTEVSFLQGKIESLDNELQEEKKSHQDAVTRCNNLLEQLERYRTATDNDETTQEIALTAAAEKLAECQETIYLLDKQLKALRPQTNPPNNVKSREVGDETSGIYYNDPSETYIANPFSSHRTWSEPTLDQLLNGPPSPSEFEPNKQIISPAESKRPNHRPTKSGSSSASSTPTPEKQSRGFSRFFSSKGKNAYV